MSEENNTQNRRQISPSELEHRKKELLDSIIIYEEHFKRAVEEGIGNLAEVFKMQIVNLQTEIDTLDSES